MPAVSKAQQRFMGMVHAVQKGDMEAPSKEIEKAADSMSDKDAKDYASTSHKGLSNKKENMKITRERLKELVKEVMTEESEYQAFFQKALDKAGKSIPSMSDEEKKAFFDKIDSAWNGKGEKNEDLKGDQHKLDVDKDGDIEGDDLADLRAGKKVDEAANLKTISMLFQNKGIRDAVRKDHADKLRKIIEDSGISTKGVSDSELIKAVKQLTNESVNEDVNFRDGKYRFYSKQGVGYLTYDGKVLSHGDFDWEDGSNSYWMSHSSWGGQKAFDTGKDVIAYFKSKKITTESTNEAELPSATIPTSVKSKLMMVIDKIKDTKLTYNQKIQVVGKVMDSLGVDKSEFNKMSSKLKGTMESSIKSIKEESPCWKGYKQIGMKDKGGKQVPNCVPA